MENDKTNTNDIFLNSYSAEDIWKEPTKAKVVSKLIDIMDDNSPKIVEQTYKGATKRYADAKNLPQYASSKIVGQTLEPIYLNLFEVIIDFPEVQDMDFKSLTDNFISCEVKLKKGKIIIESEDNAECCGYMKFLHLYENDIVIPRLQISIYTRKGDVFIQREFFNLNIRKISPDLKLDYTSGTKILKFKIVLDYNFKSDLFLGDYKFENNVETPINLG